MTEFTNYKYGFEQLYKANYARLYYYAFQFISDAETCKDIVNDGLSCNSWGINIC